MTLQVVHHVVLHNCNTVISFQPVCEHASVQLMHPANSSSLQYVVAVTSFQPVCEHARAQSMHLANSSSLQYVGALLQEAPMENSDST